MKSYTSNHIKNVALFGHAGSGKTTIAETMLFEAGAITRRGTVEEGNTISDFHDLEHERKNTVFASLMHLEWKDSKINLIDTPGYDDFVGEVFSALKVTDTGIVILNSQYGVEVGTEIIWAYAAELKKPLLFAINQLDAEKADYETTLEQLKNRFGSKVVVMQYPVNQGEDFDAIIDVLRMVMYKFGPDGGKPEKLPIPEDQKERADALHNTLVEAAAENDEGLMEKYFEKGSLDEVEMQAGLQIAMQKAEMFPVFCVSAKRNMGSGRIMGFIDNVCPASTEAPATAMKDGSFLDVDASAEPVVYVYKTISEPHLGDMSFFKVCSGEITTGMDLFNLQTSSSERLSQLFVMNGNKRDNINKLVAGDIGATVKLKNTHTNNTLGNKGSNAIVAPIDFPAPRIRTAIESVNKGDEDKIGIGLHQIVEEDPTLKVEYSTELKQTIVHGQGELHLAMLRWKLKNRYKVDIEFARPRIPYRETIQRATKSSYRHKKQSGGAGQFGEVHMLVEPYYEGMPAPADYNVRGTEEIELDWGGKLVVLNCIVGGSIDNKYMTAIQKGIMEKMTNGPLTGSYVRDVRVSIYDGKMHAVDSNDMAFKIAGMQAFREAFKDADPKIMEPIFDVEVTVPDSIMGDIMSDLQTRHAMILGTEVNGHLQRIKAKVPLSELYKYSSTLRSLSQGRAKHTRAFAEYSPVSMETQKKLMSKHTEVFEEA